MTNVVRLQTTNRRLDDASRWILRLENGLSKAQEEAFQEWLSASEENRKVLIEVATAWDKLTTLSRLAEIFPWDPDEQVCNESVSRGPVGFSVSFASLILAFSIAVGVLVSSNGFNNSVEQSIVFETANFQTRNGERSREVLPDGSVLYLNDSSKISIAFKPDARILRLDRGELYIDVVKDVDRPLSIIAGEHVVRALGTAFSVQLRQDNSLEVIVSEGEVVVGTRAVPESPPPEAQFSKSGPIRTPILNHFSKEILGPGDGFFVNDSEETIKHYESVDISKVLSWRNRSLVFISEPLPHVLEDIQRESDIKFVLLDEDLKTLTLSGRFKAGDVDILLGTLKANLNINYEYDKNGQIFLSRK